MIAKLKYRDATNGKCETPDTYFKDIDSFIHGIHHFFKRQKTLELSLMPGDGTHYSFRVEWANEKSKWLSIEDNTSGWHIIIPKYMSPCFLKKSLTNTPPWSAALVCDLANRICGTNHQSFYNWDESVPTYVLEGVEPQGWESRESEECDE